MSEAPPDFILLVTSPAWMWGAVATFATVVLAGCIIVSTALFLDGDLKRCIEMSQVVAIVTFIPALFGLWELKAGNAITTLHMAWTITCGVYLTILLLWPAVQRLRRHTRA